MSATDWAGPTGSGDRGRLLTRLFLLVIGGLMLAAGVWALAAPRSFAEFAGFPYNAHFLHDVGAFQIGIGMMLLLAAAWTDAAAVTLAGFLVANTVHTVNHIVDLDVGGHSWEAWALGLISLVTAAALVGRMRQLGWVAGDIATTAAVAALAPFVRQKTVLLTSYRRNGTPVGTPVSIAVDGDRAYVRTPGNSVKVKRIRRDPMVELAPCTALGRPTGPAVRMRAQLLQGPEYRHAGQLLAGKYPMLQGALVPLVHRLGRAKIGQTVHLRLTPTDAQLANGVARTERNLRIAR